MTTAAGRIASNLSRVREQMAEAARRAGRNASDVSLVAVTKYVTAPVAQLLFEAGCRDFGESRPQELWDKADQLESLDISWHMIGHLQRNKLQKTLPRVAVVQSVDSQRLLQAIEQWARKNDTPIRLLIEVNVSGDVEKHGFAPSDAQQAVRLAEASPWTDLRGLMCMASREGGLESARADFRRLRLLRDEMTSELPAAANFELSMGMSRDFPVAIEEGATIIRVGSALFEGIDRS